MIEKENMSRQDEMKQQDQGIEETLGKVKHKSLSPPLVSKEGAKMESTEGKQKIKIAVPSSEGLLSNHFGHCDEFMLFDIENSQIVGRKTLPPPPHEPGTLPRWLSERGAKVIIAGGMGSRARGFFSQYGIEVVTGAPVLAPEKIIAQYLAGTLETGQNICDH